MLRTLNEFWWFYSIIVDMMKLIALISNYIVLCLRLLSRGGVRAVAAENMVLRQQLITLSRNQKRAPRLTFFEKITFGLFASMISARRLTRIAIILKPATLLKFHKALVNHKYRLLFSNKSSKKPGPKGPDDKIIHLILEMKQRNPRWLTFIGHMKDSLWSIDLFRSESIHLKTHWIMVVMDQFTRRIIGFSVHKGSVTGIELCCMFNRIISKKLLPNYLSSDNDPLFHFHQWQANCRILDIEEIKSVPYVPTSHPFIERLIGSVRREILDKTLYWNACDLQNKLELFQNYYNEERGHHGIDGITPLKKQMNHQTRWSLLIIIDGKSIAKAYLNYQ